MVITLAGVAWAAGIAIIAGGGTGVALTTKHKKEVADLQSKIDELQHELLVCQHKIEELIKKIEMLEQEKANLIKQIEENQAQLTKVYEYQNAFMERLKINDSRFKKIIYTLTFRLGVLRKENEELRKKLAIANGYMSMKQSEIDEFELHNENVEAQIISSVNELKQVNFEKQAIEEELRQLA